MMPAAPIKAARRALDAAGLKIADMAAIKSHNPFVVNDIAFARETGADLMAMNNYGCPLVWGHPQGPTGPRARHRADRGTGAARRRLRPVPRLRRRRHRDGRGRRSRRTRAMAARAADRRGRRCRPCPPTLAHLLIHAVRLAPHAEALVCGDLRIIYTQVSQRRVAGFANGSPTAQGLNAASAWRSSSANSIEMAVATFAAHLAGAQAVLLNPIYTARELSVDLVEDAEPALLLVSFRPGLCVSWLPSINKVQGSNLSCSSALAKRCRSYLPCRTLVFLADHPKPFAPDAAIHRRHERTAEGRRSQRQMPVAINMRAARGARCRPARPASASFAVTPLFHSYATAMAPHLAAYCAGTLVILPRYSAERRSRRVGGERITIFAGQPDGSSSGLMALPVFRCAASSPPPRRAISGSAALPAATLRAGRRASPAPISTATARPRPARC